MSNYTKTTNFSTKDALPSGNPAKIVKGTEIDTEFNNIATAVATKSNSASPTFTGTLTAPVVTASTSLNIAGDGATVTGIKDEDDMASNSATKLATQQSIKAYVDSQVTAQDLDVTDGTTSISIDLDSEALSLLGGTGVTSTASGNGVTMAIDSTVATLTGTQTLTNKTLTSPDVNTPDIDGGTIDGTVIGGTTAAAGSFTTVGATGNITVGGTVDGRDVATDGTKLDGIEDGATADQTAAEIKTAYESNANTNAFTDADESKLDGIEALADVTDTANVTAAGALMDSELTSIASVKALDQGVATTDSPTFAAATVTGEITANGGIALGDNDKATFGAGDDLQIYHDGSDSYVDDAGTGDLVLRGNNQVLIRDTGTNEVMGNFRSSGAVTLYYDNAEKISTTATGIDVTGEITADALTINSSGVQIGTVLQSTSTTSARLALMDANTTAASQVGIGATGNTLGLYAGGGLPKVVVSGTGIDVTGTATMDGLTVDNITIDGSAVTASATNLILSSGTSAGDKLDLKAGDDIRFYVDGQNTSKLGATFESNGDISFYEDTGTTPKLFWDASAEMLTTSGLTVGLGNAEIQGTAPNLFLSETDYIGNNTRIMGQTKQFRIDTVDDNNSNNVQRFTIDHPTGDISFYEDTGTTAKMVWSASEESLELSGTGNLKIIGDGSSSTSRALLEVYKTGGGSDDFSSLITAYRPNTVWEDLNADTTDWQIFVDGGEMEFRYGDASTDTKLTSEAMRIDSSGHVGIGTSPDYPLHVANTLGFPVLIERTDSQDAGIRFKDSTTTDADSVRLGARGDDLRIFTGGAETFRIDSSGNVGIGESSPQRALHVNAGSTDIVALLQSDTNAYLSFWDSVGGVKLGSESGSMVFYEGSNSTGAGGAEAMRIDSSGNLLVGTTDNTVATQASGEGFYYNAGFNMGVARSGGTVAQFNRQTNDGEIVSFRKDGTAVGSISVTASATTYNTSSDQRLKENIADADDAGSKIDAIQVRKYDWKADGSHQDYGMIAQELVEVAPEAVSVPEDAEEMMGVDYSKLVPMLIKEIQSLRNRVAQLEE